MQNGTTLLPRPTLKPQDGFQVQFMSSEADIVVGGAMAGVGKSWCLLAEPLRHQKVRGFDCVIFRRTFAEIRNPGGLWAKSEDLYSAFGFTANQQNLEWYNKNFNVTIKFAHLQYEKDVKSHDGSEYCLICFDELQHFTKKQFLYLLSRNRSLCGVKPYVRATCNPDPDSFLAELLEWWIDQDEKLQNGERNKNWGYPIKDRIGFIRYFIVYEDEFIWGNSKEEIIEKNPHIFTSEFIVKTGDPKNLIKSITMITGSIFDNKELLRKDPGYLSNLMAQEETERLRLLFGNWKISNTDNCIFNSQAIQNIFDNPYQNEYDERYITCDAARFGDDLCTIFIWFGWKVVKLVIWTKSSANDIYTAIEKERNIFNIKKSHVIVDQDGVGGGTVKLGHYIGFSGGNSPLEYAFVKENYFNIKTQFAYRFAEIVNTENVSIVLGHENIYVDGVPGTKIKIGDKVYDVRDLIKQDFKAIRSKDRDKDGKKKINGKDEQKALLGGRSPDFFDGMNPRVWFEFKSGGIKTGLPKRKKSILDYVTPRRTSHLN
jgi:hypothetical protein